MHGAKTAGADSVGHLRHASPRPCRLQSLFFLSGKQQTINLADLSRRKPHVMADTIYDEIEIEVSLSTSAARQPTHSTGSKDGRFENKKESRLTLGDDLRT